MRTCSLGAGPVAPARQAAQPPQTIGRPTTGVCGFGLFPFRSPLLRESRVISVREVLRCFCSPLRLPLRGGALARTGFPHSDIHGSPGGRPLPVASRSRPASFVGSAAPGHPPSALSRFRQSAPSLLRSLSYACVSLCSLGNVPRPHGRRWRRGDSNPRPPPCKGGALPVELRPPGGPFWTRTRDLGLIRTALSPAELKAPGPSPLKSGSKTKLQAPHAPRAGSPTPVTVIDLEDGSPDRGPARRVPAAPRLPLAGLLSLERR